jgi:hypothetical protein
MTDKHLQTRHADKTKWYTPPAIAYILFIACLGLWFIFCGRTSQELDIQPTHLTLRGDICSFLKIKGITTTPIEPENWCSVVVPFRPYGVLGGGVIMLGDRQIRVTDNQLVEIGAVVDQPWTPEQTRSLIWAGISTLIMLGFAVWLMMAG